MQHVYVLGFNNGRFQIRSIIDAEAFAAPSLFSWRLFGPRPVPLPAGTLSGSVLSLWIAALTAGGYIMRSVSA